MFLTIPVKPRVADQKMDLTLDQLPVTLRISWNDTAGYWYLSLSHRNGEPIIGSIKMIKNTPLLKPFQLAAIRGELIFFDHNSGKERPDFYSLGHDHMLLYRS